MREKHSSFIATPIDSLAMMLDDLQETHRGTSDELSSWAARYLEYQRPRLLEELQYYQKILPVNTQILDVGSAPFYTPAVLTQLGYDVQVIDLLPERLYEFIRQTGLTVNKVNFETEPLPYQENEFDCVILAEVFEHMRIDLIATVSELMRVLKPGGYLLLSTPNFFELHRLLRLFTKGTTSDIVSEYRKLEDYGHMGHVREYTPRDVEIFLEHLGFLVDDRIMRGLGKKALGRTLKRLIPPFRNWFMIRAVKRDQTNA